MKTKTIKKITYWNGNSFVLVLLVLLFGVFGLIYFFIKKEEEFKNE